MRVLITAASCSPDYGGPAFLVTRLAQALAARGIEISVWTADGSAANTPLLPVSSAVRRIGGSLNDALGSAKSFDVIHDHGIWLPYNHRLARLCSQCRLPRVVSIHGMLDPWCLRHKALKKRIAWVLYQRADLRGAAFQHVTSEVELRNLDALKLGVPAAVIPIGVDLPHSLPKTPGKNPRKAEKTAVFLGRLHPVKGLPMLIEAWHRVRPQGWHLRVAGPDDSGHRKELEDLVDAYGLKEVVSFSGPLHGSAKETFLREADLFVLPSHSESFGLAVAEALGSQIPVLTTTAAPWTILEAEACGWSVEPTADAMTAGLRLATLQDSETLAAMGARGGRWVGSNLRWEHVAERFIDLYQQALRQE